jgi:hypothetical protein
MVYFTNAARIMKYKLLKSQLHIYFDFEKKKIDIDTDLIKIVQHLHNF